MRKQIEDMLKEHNIEYDKESAIYGDDELLYFEDDSYSGRCYRNRIDEYGYLYQSMEDDSPAQCGGWRVVSLFKEGKEYILNNIADIWSYTVINNKVYVITLDDSCAECSVSILHVTGDDKIGQEELYHRKISHKQFDKIVATGLTEFCKSKLGEIK